MSRCQEIEQASSRFCAIGFAALGLAMAAASTLAGTASVSLVWDPVTSASVVRYTVHWGTASRSYTEQTDAGPADSWTIAGLVEGTTYYIAVSAYDLLGARSDYSNEVSWTVPQGPPVVDTVAPSAPASLTATASGNAAIRLEWSAATDNVAIAGYHVEQCAGATCTEFTRVAETTDTRYTSISLVSGTTYRVRVRAADTAGNLGPYSPMVTATATATAATSAGRWWVRPHQ